MSTIEPIETVATETTRPTGVMRRRILRHGGLMFGGTVLTLVVLMAVFAPLLAPYDPYTQDMLNRLVNPIWFPDGTWAHPLGTDGLGRDYLSRIVYGARISLLIGFFTMLVSGLIGTVLGVLAGYFGGRIDALVTFMVTVRLAMPVVLVALAVVVALGSSLVVIVLVLGFLLWDRFAIVLRSATRQVRDLEYVSAARSIGCSTGYILIREILPNIGNHLIVVATLEMAHAIILEAALSFLGLGVQPPTPSWGLMIADGRQFMFFKGWLITIPGVALFALVLSINLLGDGLRDVTAPEGRN